jgi:hypothetical protein
LGLGKRICDSSSHDNYDDNNYDDNDDRAINHLGSHNHNRTINHISDDSSDDGD